MINKLARGFTLLEILVVIAIIAILSSAIYVGFDGARDRAGNESLRTELLNVRLAIELYKAQNGEYPGGTSCPSNCTSAGSRCTCRSGTVAAPIRFDTYVPDLVPNFIEALPSPREYASTCDFQYFWDTGAPESTFKLAAVRCLTDGGVEENDELARCPGFCSNSGVCNPSSGTFANSLAIYSKGYECN